MRDSRSSGTKVGGKNFGAARVQAVTITDGSVSGEAKSPSESRVAYNMPFPPAVSAPGRPTIMPCHTGFLLGRIMAFHYMCGRLRPRIATLWRCGSLTLVSLINRTRTCVELGKLVLDVQAGSRCAFSSHILGSWIVCYRVL